MQRQVWVESRLGLTLWAPRALALPPGCQQACLGSWGVGAGRLQAGERAAGGLVAGGPAWKVSRPFPTLRRSWTWVFSSAQRGQQPPAEGSLQDPTRRARRAPSEGLACFTGTELPPVWVGPGWGLHGAQSRRPASITLFFFLYYRVEHQPPSVANTSVLLTKLGAEVGFSRWDAD